MGIRTIYTCDKCEKSEKFGGISSFGAVGGGGWLVVSNIGGCSVYCSKCREEHDNLKLHEELIRNRHQQQAQQEIQDLHIRGLKPIKK